MKEKPYHHGDLRNQLIEAGIELLNEEGISGFSLRKVAARCEVSHAAPYSHFKDVKELISAMSEHVTERFTDKLRASIQGAEDSLQAISSLGKAYIAFFEENPAYFPFLYYHSSISIDLEGKQEADDLYPPFAVFKATANQVFRSMNLKEEDDTKALLALWSMVHGIASLVTSKGIHYSGDWQDVFTFVTQMGRNDHEDARS
ncbi:TetR/AcrR family transcriptional regulator [Gorillibacterium timonense]|uniref:TetR/AcrR family transcriptional regulator n=1 Tax=Gorillibacterium timonense TaxID=1689269 RepID=UPI00071D7F04|nr:TetR/AcrR family transcriptional regulator [Gorillibacterium timonense]